MNTPRQNSAIFAIIIAIAILFVIALLARATSPAYAQVPTVADAGDSKAQETTAPTYANLIGDRVTVYLTGEAMGDSVGSVTSDSMNGRRSSVHGTVLTINDTWIVIQHSNGTHTEPFPLWIPQRHIRAIAQR